MIYGHVRTLRAKGEKPNKVTYIYKTGKSRLYILKQKKVAWHLSEHVNAMQRKNVLHHTSITLYHTSYIKNMKKQAATS
jgi:hypothetical protein